MVLDLSCVVLGIVFAAFGHFTGFLAQAVKIVALLAGYVLAGMATPRLEILLGVSSQDNGPAVLVVFGIAWLLSYFLLAWILGMMAGVAKDASDSLNSADKTTGMFFGGVKGLLLGLCFIAALMFFQKALEPSWPSLPMHLQESIAAKQLQSFSYFRNNAYVPLPSMGNSGTKKSRTVQPSGLIKAYMDGGVYTIDGSSSSARQAPDRARNAIQQVNQATNQRMNNPGGPPKASPPKGTGYTPPKLSDPAKQHYKKGDPRYRKPKDRKYVPPGYTPPSYTPPAPPRPPTRP